MTDPIKTYFPVTWLLVLAALAGCASDQNQRHIEVMPHVPEPKYTSTDLDELLRFAGKTAALAPTDRLAQCKELLELRQAEASLGIRLHLLLAQSLAASCGTPREAGALTDSALAEVRDERLKAFLIYHKTLLARLDREMEHRKNLERRVSRTVTDQKKTHRRLQSQESELKILQKKLEALKAIEQSLDESNDDRQ